ncbi:MAG: hypothetical protein D6816_16500 [Bacteroidetes bacterium]|nr:MAG: hypothetical protein D6816_16500 [Bacteroidota bacterium]
MHAIYQAEDRAVIGPEMDFESLPYFDKELGQDVNSDVPYLAESIIAPPFDDTNFLLESGVHLNWDFPQFLKRTKYGASQVAEFPPAPNRWLISRFSGESKIPEKQWVIESDALLTNLKGAKIYDMAQTSLPVDIHSGERPYTYMGRVERLENWLKNQHTDGDFTTWKEKHSNKPLTAVGWGSLSFDVFYPNCRGVFAFHDPFGTKEHQYVVSGWYADPDADDYWLYYLRTKAGTWGFEAVDRIEHLDEAQKKALKFEQVSKAIRADLGIEIQGLGQRDVETFTQAENWQGMQCYGKARFIDEQLFDADQLFFAAGNTPVEALTAMIAERVVGETNSHKKEKLEDSLSAILMGDRLKSKKLDIGPKFREFRHADEFMATQGGLEWIVEKIDDNPSKTPRGQQVQDSKSPPPLPEKVAPLLESLNEAQRTYDKAARELESYRFELYADWYRYLHASYPPRGETEEYVEVSDLRAAIEAGSLAKVKKWQKLLGSKEIDGNGHISGLVARVEIAKAALQKALDEINEQIEHDEKLIEKFHWEIQHRPADRFWEPAPPALVIAIPRRQIDETSGKTEKAIVYPTLQIPQPCHVYSGDVLDDDNLPLASETSDDWKVLDRPLSTDLPIFRGEWEAEVFPVATMNSATRSSATYDPNFILNNYLLAENEPDLDDHPSLVSQLALTKNGSIYRGSAYVNQKIDDRYRYLLQKYREIQSANSAEQQADAFLSQVAAAENFLDEHDLLVITLNGFNAALLQRHESIQLNPADPLGFADYQAFARDVATTLQNNFKGLSPDPHITFMPVRSGALRIVTLRLVDIFGRFIDLTPTNVATAVSMTVPDHDEWVRLPPRLAQAARWNFRFLQANPAQPSDEPAASHTHPRSTPIHGWIVPNLLDHSLDFFAQDGKKLGSVRTRDGKPQWEPQENRQPTGYMKRIIDWLIDPAKGDGFLDALIENIEEAMDNIHPDDREGQSAFSVLMGRPMAVVHLGIDLELKGLPAVNNSWGDLIRDLKRTERATDDFEKIQFPYRLGEYHQRNDGLLGYWGVQEDGRLEGSFAVNDSASGSLNMSQIRAYTPGQTGNQWLDEKNEEWRVSDTEGKSLFEYLLAQEDETIKKQDLALPYIRESGRLWEVLIQKGYLTEERTFKDHIRHYAEAARLHISPADTMQQFVALVDPHGLVHLTSGIQPVKAIQLPDRFVKDALNRIEMSFLTAPVLTPEDQVQISLPTEQAYSWAWQEPNQWLQSQPEIDEADIRPFRTTAYFPKRAVLREGQLTLKHKVQVENEEEKS